MADQDPTHPATVTIPPHSPLYKTTVDYGGHVEGFKVLLSLPEDAVRELLAPTPFGFVSSHAWVDVLLYKTLEGLAPYDVAANDPYTCLGFFVPADYNGIVGSYCANYYKNKDFGIAPGRESAGYPVKHAELHYQHTGRAITASVSCPTARFEASLVTGHAEAIFPPEILTRPTLLIHQVPDVEVPDGTLIRQIISRGGASSRIVPEPAEGFVNYHVAPSGVDDLGWLKDARPIASVFLDGPMRGSTGKVLSTNYVSEGLAERILLLGQDSGSLVDNS